MLEIYVLGPLEVVAAGKPVPLTRAKPRALLALLLVYAGEVVSTDRLIDELWSGRPPATAKDALQNYVSHLRKALGRNVVVTRAPGYVLEIAPEQTDAGQFEQLAAEARSAERAEDTAAKLREGLDLWRGSAYADFSYDSFAQLEASRLEELRAAVREDLVDSELELGRHTELVPELEELVAEQPYRERIRAQLMLALYRSGRQAEALEAFQAARQTLADELGLDPSPALRALEQSILVQDPTLGRPAAEAAATPSLEQRRKTVTVLSAEATPAEALDPERHHTATVQALGIARNAIEAHGGWVQAQAGDALLGIFGLPASHEDDALRAVRAAAEIRRAAALRSDLPLELRIGVDTGAVLAGHGFVSGDVVSTAKRLHVKAGAGDVLLGDETVALARHAITTEAAGSASRLLEVEENVPAVARYLEATLVGRANELAVLMRAYDEAAAGDRFRLLTLVGEPGIGKTRLANELAALVRDKATILVGRCVSYGEGTTYLPLREMVTPIGGDLPSALAGEEDAELVEQRVLELVGLAEGTAPAAEGAWAIRRLFETLGRQRPLLLVFEDVHWAEPTLLDLIEQLRDRASGPALVLLITRPFLGESRPDWLDDSLILAPLSHQDSAALVTALPGSDALADDTRARIADTAEGNPLFAEQLLAYAQEGGPAALDAVPPSVEALIASRLDLLQTDERGVLQRAAVAGRDFSSDAVAELSPEEPALSAHLLGLVRKGLVHPITVRDSDEAYRFHHVLVRNVAYEGLPKVERAELHEAFGDWLAQQPDPTDEVVGYHLEQAYRYHSELGLVDRRAKQLAADAGGRLGAAGMRDWKRSDVPATINLLGRATSLLPEDDSWRRELLCELGLALDAAGDSAGAEETLREAVAAAEAVIDVRIGHRARLELAFVRLRRDPEGKAEALIEVTAKAIPVLEELGDDRGLARAWLLVGWAEGGAARGQHSAWERAAERALVYYRRAALPATTCLGQIAAALYYGPARVERATNRCEELLGDEASNRAGHANVLRYLGGLVAMVGDLARGRELVEQARGMLEELGQRGAAQYCAFVRGDIDLLAGETDAARRARADLCAYCQESEDYGALSTAAADLADVLYGLKSFDEAEHWATVSGKHAATDDVGAQFAWRAVCAKVLARREAFEDAEALAREAVRLAETTDALNKRAGVLLSLAEVLRLAGRPQEATGAVDQAIALYEQKGNALGAARARALLEEHALA